jgi:hypothetical protein
MTKGYPNPNKGVWTRIRCDNSAFGKAARDKAAETLNSDEACVTAKTLSEVRRSMRDNRRKA